MHTHEESERREINDRINKIRDSPGYKLVQKLGYFITEGNKKVLINVGSNMISCGVIKSVNLNALRVKQKL